MNRTLKQSPSALAFIATTLLLIPNAFAQSWIVPVAADQAAEIRQTTAGVTYVLGEDMERHDSWTLERMAPTTCSDSSDRWIAVTGWNDDEPALFVFDALDASAHSVPLFAAPASPPAALSFSNGCVFALVTTDGTIALVEPHASGADVIDVGLEPIDRLEERRLGLLASSFGRRVVVSDDSGHVAALTFGADRVLLDVQREAVGVDAEPGAVWSEDGAGLFFLDSTGRLWAWRVFEASPVPLFRSDSPAIGGLQLDAQHQRLVWLTTSGELHEWASLDLATSRALPGQPDTPLVRWQLHESDDVEWIVVLRDGRVVRSNESEWESLVSLSARARGGPAVLQRSAQRSPLLEVNTFAGVRVLSLAVADLGVRDEDAGSGIWAAYVDGTSGWNGSTVQGGWVRTSSADLPLPTADFEPDPADWPTGVPCDGSGEEEPEVDPETGGDVDAGGSGSGLSGPDAGVDYDPTTEGDAGGATQFEGPSFDGDESGRQEFTRVGCSSTGGGLPSLPVWIGLLGLAFVRRRKT